MDGGKKEGKNPKNGVKDLLVKKFLRQQRKKLKKALEDGRASHAHEPMQLMLWNDCPTQSNLHIQCNPHQNSSAILYRSSKAIPKSTGKVKHSWIDKGILSKQSSDGKITMPDLNL